jgi:hypothetical protein
LARSFSDCESLTSVFIPSTVITIEEGTFANCESLESCIFETGSELALIESSVFDCCCSLESMVVPASVRVLSEYCFGGCTSLSRLAFEDGSQLVRIDFLAGSCCSSLEVFDIPSFVADLNYSAFSDSGVREIRVSERSRDFRVSGDFLLSSHGREAVLYFGRDSEIRIDREIEIISGGLFQLSPDCLSVEFGSDSQLREIGNGTFSDCPVFWALVDLTMTRFPL